MTTVTEITPAGFKVTYTLVDEKAVPTTTTPKKVLDRIQSDLETRISDLTKEYPPTSPKIGYPKPTISSEDTQAIYDHNVEAQAQWDNRTKSIADILNSVRQDYAYFTNATQPTGMTNLEFNILKYGQLTRLQCSLRLELDALGLSNNDQVCIADTGLGTGRTNEYKKLLKQHCNGQTLKL